MAMRTTGVKMDFEKLIAKGENPNGFTAQTANGTAHWKGTGWNKDEPNWDRGPVDFSPSPWDSSDHQVRPDATRPDGRSNRTGE